MFPPRRRYHHNLWSTDGLTILANWFEIVAILVHYQPSYDTLHTMKPSDHCCSRMMLCAAECILQAKLTSLDTLPPLTSPRVTILSGSPVRILVHHVVKHSRLPDLNASSNVSLPLAWITGPRKRSQLNVICGKYLKNQNSAYNRMSMIDRNLKIVLWLWTIGIDCKLNLNETW
jgi:hypothetical protein